MISIYAVLSPGWRGPWEVCPPRDARLDLRAAGAADQRCGDHTLTQQKDDSWSSEENTGVLTVLLLPEHPNAFVPLTTRMRFVLTIPPLYLREVVR